MVYFSDSKPPQALDDFFKDTGGQNQETEEGP